MYVIDMKVSVKQDLSHMNQLRPHMNQPHLLIRLEDFLPVNIFNINHFIVICEQI